MESSPDSNNSLSISPTPRRPHRRDYGRSLRPDSFIEESDEEGDDTAGSADVVGIPAITVLAPGDAPASLQASPAHHSFYQFQNASASSTSSLHAPHHSRGHVRAGSSASAHYVPASALPPRSSEELGSPMRSSRQRMGSPVRSPSPVKRPFTFGGGPSLAVPLSSPLPKPSRRRGHHYKHSSVSMNMFQQPDRAADQTNKELPQYPVPSISSVLSSVTTPQRLRLAWCVFQLSLAPICYALGFHYGNICLSTLSHVVFYDAFGNILSVVVMILTNFDVWKSSSLKYPFGLGRIEVLVGFGLSVSLVFVGIDLLSHVIEEFIIALAVDSAGVDSMNSEEAEAAAVALSHHVHETTGGTQLNPLLYEALICLVVLVSLLSSSIVRGKRDEDDEDNVRTDGIFLPGKRSIVSAKRLSSITLEAPKKHSILHHLSSTRNGVNACTTALTLIYSAYSLLYPLIHATNSIEVLNEASTVALSLLILTFGYRLIDRLGNTLLLKSPPESVKQMILKNIQQLDVYRPDYKVEEFLISRVNHKIFIIVLRLVMPGASDDDEAKFRFYAARIIRSLMYRSMNGELDGPEKVDRKSLVALLNLDAAFDTMDESGEQFEITIDIAT